MFESTHWFRELAATLGILASATGLAAFFFGFTFSLPVGLGITILVIWLLHRRAVRIRGESQPAQGGA